MTDSRKYCAHNSEFEIYGFGPSEDRAILAALRMGRLNDSQTTPHEQQYGMNLELFVGETQDRTWETEITDLSIMVKHLLEDKLEESPFHIHDDKIDSIRQVPPNAWKILEKSMVDWLNEYLNPLEFYTVKASRNVEPAEINRLNQVPNLPEDTK